MGQDINFTGSQTTRIKKKKKKEYHRKYQSTHT